jgi:hypothetical protein
MVGGLDMDKTVAKYIRDLKSRAEIPDVVMAEMSEAGSYANSRLLPFCDKISSDYAFRGLGVRFLKN